MIYPLGNPRLKNSITRRTYDVNEYLTYKQYRALAPSQIYVIEDAYHQKTGLENIERSL